MHPSDCLCLVCVPACAPPTKVEFDALPPNWRRYVADLETNADPAGAVRENAMLRDRVVQLEALAADLQLQIEEDRERHRKELPRLRGRLRPRTKR